MRKFKHKQTGIIGEVREDNFLHFERKYGNMSSHETLSMDFVQGSSDWEEVKEPEYEILTFSLGNTEATLRGNGLYLNSVLDKEGEYDLASFKNFSGDFSPWEISSVKRLKDGEIFTVGDNLNGGFEVVKILVRGDTIWITTCEGTDDFGILLAIAHKAKQKMFTSRDGVDVFEGDTFYVVENFRVREVDGRQYLSNKWQEYRYVDKKKAQFYCDRFKVQYSAEDVLEIVNFWSMSPVYVENIINEFKNRTK